MRLILGDGLLGSELIKITGYPYLSRKKDQYDVLIGGNMPILLRAILKYEVDLIINTIAYTDTYGKDKEKAWGVNVVWLDSLIRFCNLHQIKLVHISTDYLYTYSEENATEEDVPVHNRSWYGYSKLVGDALIQLHSNNYLICRSTHKPRPFPYSQAWINQVGNFDYVDKIAELILKLVNKKAYGVYNVGTGRKTMYDLARKTLRSVKKAEAGDLVPKNITMICDKLYTL